MPFYDVTFIGRQDLTPAQVEQFAAAFAKIASDRGAKVVRTEFWGLRKLAYKINKNARGHYVMLTMDAPAEAVQEVERNMRLSEDILRFLTIRNEELSKEPSPMYRNNSDANDVRVIDGAPAINLDALKDAKAA